MAKDPNKHPFDLDELTREQTADLLCDALGYLDLDEIQDCLKLGLGEADYDELCARLGAEGEK